MGMDRSPSHSLHQAVVSVESETENTVPVQSAGITFSLPKFHLCSSFWLSPRVAASVCHGGSTVCHGSCLVNQVVILRPNTRRVISAR